MFKKNILFLLILLPCIIHGQQETFINPKNIATNQVVKEEVVEFIQNTEERNEQIRATRTNDLAELLADDDFTIPTTARKFEPIDAIVLDAGHGGKDPGGVSNGVEEKRLNLTLVKKLHTLFRKQNRNIKIYVTRNNDSFVSLEDRVSKTARWSSKKNILFISIHANIAYNPSVSGFEIYTLSDQASDTEALATERIENAGFTQQDIQQTESLYSLLADLIRDGTRKESEWLAEYIYNDTIQTANAYGRGLKRANFFVLKYNTVPSVLIEVGYMSNKAEAEKLKTEDYLNKLTVGMYKGISRYINEYNESEGFSK